MEKFPFRSGQPLQPDEQKPGNLEDVLKKFGDNVSADAAKERRKQSLRTTAQVEGWSAAQDSMTNEEREASER